jgi:hypothetical protein
VNKGVAMPKLTKDHVSFAAANSRVPGLVYGDELEPDEDELYFQHPRSKEEVDTLIAQLVKTRVSYAEAIGIYAPLNELQDLLKFHEQLDKMLRWVSTKIEKHPIVNVQNTFEEPAYVGQSTRP